MEKGENTWVRAKQPPNSAVVTVSAVEQTVEQKAEQGGDAAQRQHGQGSCRGKAVKQKLPRGGEHGGAGTQGDTQALACRVLRLLQGEGVPQLVAERQGEALLFADRQQEEASRQQQRL